VPALCFDLLLYLIRHSDTALSREQLWTDVWGAGARNDIRTVDVQIHMLRKLIEDDPATPRRILTVPRIGYLFRREVDVSFEAS
jgi:DNA-binding response OmpR family regulator